MYSACFQYMSDNVPVFFMFLSPIDSKDMSR